MNHKTAQIALYAALMGAAPVWGQQAPATSNVTIYGILDLGIERVSVGNAAHDTTWRQGFGTIPTRLGFRGSEDLGGGMKAIFQLEQGFSADTGVLSQGNRAWGRQAFVGLQSDLGTISLGRQYTMRYYGILDADLFGSGAHGLGVLDSGIPNARADNAINYRGTFGPVSLGATYSVGRDTVSAANPTATNCPGETTPSKQCRTVATMLKYAGGNWGVVGSFERQHGGTAGTFGGLTNPELTDNRLMLNAYLHVAGGKYAIGWIKRNNEGSTATPKSNLYWLVGSQPITEQVVLDAMLSGVKFENSPNKAAQFNFRANYVFSKRTSIYLSTAYLKNGGSLALTSTSNAPATAPVAGGSQNGIMAGIRHSF